MNDSLHCTERWSHSIYYPAAFLNISKYFNETFTNIFLQQEIFHQSGLWPGQRQSWASHCPCLGEGGRWEGCWPRGWGRMVRRGSQVLCPEYQVWLQTDSHTLTANTITPKYPIQTKYFLTPRIVNLMLILNISR